MTPDGDAVLDLPRSSPEAHGVPSEALARLLRRWEDSGLEPHAVVVLRDGHVVAEASWAPYDRDRPGLVYSVSKTVTACAVGFAVAEGRLGLQDRLVDLFPEAASVAGPRAAALTLHDVLAMRTGHREDTLVHRGRGVTTFPQTFLSREPEDEVGSFVYHNGATLLAALAVQRATGERLSDYLRPRLFEPVGITGTSWQSSEGLDIGFSGLHVSTEGIARLGELVRCDGLWRGRRVLPEGWVQRMTAVHTDTSAHPGSADWQQGYGYQMWRCRHDAVRADGAFGQFSVVVPDARLVLALTSCTDRTQETLDAVWEELLPALSDEPLPPDPDAAARLAEWLATRSLPVRASSADPTGDGPWRSEHTPVPDHPRLTAVTVRRGTPGEAGDWVLTVDDDGPVEVPCGDGSWAGSRETPYAATGGWSAPDTFEATVVAVETPHALSVRLHAGTVSARWNGVPLGPPVLGLLHAPDADGRTR